MAANDKKMTADKTSDTMEIFTDPVSFRTRRATASQSAPAVEESPSISEPRSRGSLSRRIVSTPENHASEDSTSLLTPLSPTSSTTLREWHRESSPLPLDERDCDADNVTSEANEMDSSPEIGVHTPPSSSPGPVYTPKSDESPIEHMEVQVSEPCGRAPVNTSCTVSDNESTKTAPLPNNASPGALPRFRDSLAHDVRNTRDDQHASALCRDAPLRHSRRIMAVKIAEKIAETASQPVSRPTQAVKRKWPTSSLRETQRPEWIAQRVRGMPFEQRLDWGLLDVEEAHYPQ